MDVAYLAVPIICVLIFGLLLFLLVQFNRTKQKSRFIVTIPITIAFFLIGGFLSWSFTEIALYPKITINGQPFVFEGHRYTPDNHYDSNKIPYARLKMVAFEKIRGMSDGENLFHFIFFPYKIYVEKNDPMHRVIWERGLMFDAKYDRTT